MASQTALLSNARVVNCSQRQCTARPRVSICQFPQSFAVSRRQASPAQLSSQRRQHGLQSLTVCAASTETKAPATTAKEEVYDVYLTKPLGLRFGRGNDGGAYIIQSDARLGDTDTAIEVGDKIVKVSASFGEEVWEAQNYGQVVYAIKTRNGQVYLQLRRNFGDMSALEEKEMTEAERRFSLERGGGNYGAGTKEIQQQNYIQVKENARKRKELFNDALIKFRDGKIQDALIDFENVLSMEPKNYLGDDFSRVTQIYRASQYNIACCYSAINQEEAGLDALRAALNAGFEDFAKVRSDPNLAFLRESKAFKPLIDKYDEPLINEAAMDALKSIFSFGKKK